MPQSRCRFKEQLTGQRAYWTSSNKWLQISEENLDTLHKIIHVVSQFISKLREWACKTGKLAEEFGEAAISKVGKSVSELQQNALEVGIGIKEGAKRVAGDCREGVEKITQKFTQKFKT